MKRVVLVVMLFFAYACATTKPSPQQLPQVMHGIASWYGEEFAGRTTANGEIFDPMQFTAAHRTLPFGTVVDVTNPKTNQTVRVRINDRGPYIGQRVIDLSYAAAQQISLIEPGSGDVDIHVVKIGGGETEPPAPYEVKIEAPKEKVVISSEEPPKVDFPLPSQTNVPPVPTADSDFRVDVETQRGGVDTRRQVAPDGKTIEEVPRTPIVVTVPSSKPKAAPHKGGFVVQVGAFSIENNARLLQAQLTRIGQTSFIDHDDLYRVRIGPFATREQALTVRTTLEKSGLSAIIVAE